LLTDLILLTVFVCFVAFFV